MRLGVDDDVDGAALGGARVEVDVAVALAGLDRGHGGFADDRLDQVAAAANDFAASDARLILFNGGTGIAQRDTTYDVLARMIEKPMPGFGEIFRMLSYEKVRSSTMQSRATGGVAGGTYLFALPGSPGACRDGWEEILRWQLDSRFRPCNLVELMPRLQEHLKAEG